MEKVKKILLLGMLSVLLLPSIVKADTLKNSFKETLDDEISVFGTAEGYEDYINILKNTDLSNYKEDSKKVNVYVFRGSSCGYCLKAVAFFASIVEDYGDKFNLYTYEVWQNEDNSDLLNKVAKKLGKDEVSGVPFIVVGNQSFDGYTSSYDDSIIKAIEDEYDKDKKYDVMENLDVKDSKSTNVIIVLGVIVVGLVGLVFFMKTNVKEK